MTAVALRVRRRSAAARGGRPADRQAGAAVVEFTLVTVLLLALFLMVVQVGLVLHARNVLVAAAAEGARYGANADRTAEQGAQRAQQVAADSLGGVAADDVEALPGTGSVVGGAQVLEIVVRTDLPVVLLPGGHVRITVRGHALEEGAG